MRNSINNCMGLLPKDVVAFLQVRLCISACFLPFLTNMKEEMRGVSFLLSQRELLHRRSLLSTST